MAQGLIMISAATPADLAALAAIEEAADQRFTERFGPLDWGAPESGAARAERPGFLLVARTGGDAVVGFAHVLLVDGDAHLEQLAVLPEAGRSGVGRALVRAALRGAADRGAARVTLRTFADVPWNAPFYRSEGFRDGEPDTPFLRGLVDDEARAGLDRHGRRVQLTLDLTSGAPADDDVRPGDLGERRQAGDVLVIARRAMAEILTPEELASATAAVLMPSPAWVRADPSRERPLDPADWIGHDERLLRITVLGETASMWLSTQWAEDDAELFDRIRSDLQDFVAESTFGWGQLRP